MFGDTPRVVDIIVRAATVLRWTTGILKLRKATLIPQLHREANDCLCPFMQDGSHGRAIHTTAHGYSDRVSRWRGASGANRRLELYGCRHIAWANCYFS
jgi:hypothetical protein